MRNILIAALLLMVIVVKAQPPRPAPTPNDTLQAVRVVSNIEVQLSIYAPKATAVTVFGDFLKEYKPMVISKADNGIWSVTINGLTPDVYTCYFTVDSIKTFDPKNPQYKEGENSLSNIFELPGAKADYCAVKMYHMVK